MVDLQSAVALGGRGTVRVLVRLATAGALHTRDRLSGFLGHHRDAGPGAHSWDRPCCQRHPGMVCGRRPVHAALRTHQDRVRHLGIAPVGRPADGAGLAARDADSADPGGGNRARAHRRPTGPRPDGVAGHHPARLAVVRGPTAESLRHFAARNNRGGRSAGCLRGIPERAGAILVGSERRHPGRRLPGPSG